jgi:hypothetical protein
MLKRIFGSKQEEVNEGWRKSHYELHTAYSLLNSTGSTEQELER